MKSGSNSQRLVVKSLCETKSEITAFNFKLRGFKQQSQQKGSQTARADWKNMPRN